MAGDEGASASNASEKHRALALAWWREHIDADASPEWADVQAAAKLAAHVDADARREERERLAASPPQDGIALIAAERRRQVESESWTAEHDDEHGGDEMAWAAVCYAAPDWVFTASNVSADEKSVDIRMRDPWPWEKKWDKRAKLDKKARGRIRRLVIAGALIAAELDRLLRAEAASASEPEAKPTP